MKTLGFIGMGNMAKAIAEGIIKSGKMSGQDVYAYAPHQDKLQKNAEAIGFMPCATMEELLEASDTVVMACKPYQIEGVLEMYRDALAGKALVSIAAGWDFAKYKPLLDASTRVQFIMPNTPAMVGEGVMLFEETHSLEEEERKELFRQTTKTRKALYLTMVTTYGLKPNTWSGMIQNEVVLDDLFLEVR